jgi:hypothetical protein
VVCLQLESGCDKVGAIPKIAMEGNWFQSFWILFSSQDLKLGSTKQKEGRHEATAFHGYRIPHRHCRSGSGHSELLEPIDCVGESAGSVDSVWF